MKKLNLKVLYLACGAILLLTLLSNGWFVSIIIALLDTKLQERWLDYWWTDLLDPVVGMGTFIFAWYIWRMEQKQLKLDSYAKKLTVHFKYNNAYIMSCFEAYLSSESDIRAWAQSIGMQMNDNSQIQFLPYFTIPEKEISHDREVIIHQIIVHLKELPKERNSTVNAKMKEKYIWWEANDDTTLGNEEYCLAQHLDQKAPPTLEELHKRPDKIRCDVG